MEKKLKTKKIILKPIIKKEFSTKELLNFINNVKDKIDFLYIDPDKDFVNKINENIKIIYPSKNADYVIANEQDKIEDLLLNTPKTKNIGIYKKITNNSDINALKTLVEKGIQFVIIDVDDWKIIPLENIIALLHKSNTEIFAIAKTVKEIETLFTVLELGVDGVVLSTNNEDDINKAKDLVKESSIKIKTAKILEIEDVGIGERVCIDTVSMLTAGEGMLVGNKSNFLYLVHNESIGSSFTSPRPFRVNAGAVHCYTIMPDGSTKYLSELESGSKVLIVNSNGLTRTVTVGRAKIETRPLRLFKAMCDGEIGTIIVQNAETIRFLNPMGKVIPVTHVKIGDEILVYANKPTGRHFGMEVTEEFILEK